MVQYIILAVTATVSILLLWKNRKNLEDSFKHGESGFSARKMIAFQLMFAVLTADIVYVYLLYKESPFAQKLFNEWQNTHLLYVMFVLGFLSVPEIIKFIETIKGSIKSEEENKTKE